MRTAVAETSLRAYRSLSSEDLTRTQRQILDAMQPGQTYTRRELEIVANMRTGPVCGRVKELLDAGHIEVKGEKLCTQSGRMVEALQLAAVQLELI